MERFLASRLRVRTLGVVVRSCAKCVLVKERLTREVTERKRNMMIRTSSGKDSSRRVRTGPLVDEVGMAEG